MSERIAVRRYLAVVSCAVVDQRIAEMSANVGSANALSDLLSSIGIPNPFRAITSAARS